MGPCRKTTPLNPWHKQAGANMSDFGGFDMPLWYPSGVKAEHLAVLTVAGIFDTSHMACILVRGKDALPLLNFCFTRDIIDLGFGRCVYGAFLNSAGHCLDDAIVYRFADDYFLVCVNAGMGEIIARHLNDCKKVLAVEIRDMSGQVAKMDIQGPAAPKIMTGLIKDPDAVFTAMPYFSFKGRFDTSMPCEFPVQLLDNTPVLLSRSGYTGEIGFEIFLNPEAVTKLWLNILSAGRDAGVIPCGLGARDSLRAGACLPLSHQDIGPWKFRHHPWEFALPFTADKSGFTKDFIGADALLVKDPDEHYTYPFVGDSLRKVGTGDGTEVIAPDGSVIGRVLSCVTDMGITLHEGKVIGIDHRRLSSDIPIKGLSCGFVRVSESLPPGTLLTLREGRRSISVTVVTDIRPNRTARKKLSDFL